MPKYMYYTRVDYNVVLHGEVGSRMPTEGRLGQGLNVGQKVYHAPAAIPITSAARKYGTLCGSGVGGGTDVQDSDLSNMLVDCRRVDQLILVRRRESHYTRTQLQLTRIEHPLRVLPRSNTRRKRVILSTVQQMPITWERNRTPVTGSVKGERVFKYEIDRDVIYDWPIYKRQVKRSRTQSISVQWRRETNESSNMK
ncbi:hypothetical protein BDQ17DRAFT_1410952 [Cyathus striatus]|nr:hypothetical protein BDQ17DRAFT_1410952 [Cyathus striatus]